MSVSQQPSHSKDLPASENISIPLNFIIFFSVLNGTMFPVAVPDISAEFAILPSEVSWVMTGYILVFAVGSLIYGKLADIYPVKNLITTGLLLLNGGSIAGVLSIWYPVLIAARVLQAAGGAAIPALAMIVVTRYCLPDNRGRVLGFIASTVALAAGLGPIIGGFISGMFHWRYLFIAPLATMIAIPHMRRVLPDETKRNNYFDLKGAVLISGGASSLLVFVTQGNLWMMTAGLLLIIWFTLHIRRVKTPFIHPSVFRNQSFRSAVLVTFLSIGMVFGMMFMIPLMLRHLNDLSANYIGLTMFPGAMSAVLMGFIGGSLSDSKGSVFVVYLGQGFLIGGFFLLSTFAGQTPLIIALSLVVCYSGFAFLQSSLPHTVSMVLSEEHIGIGMGIYNLLFFISGAFSSAIIGRVLDMETMSFCLNPLTESVTGWIYSNILVLMAAVVIVAGIIFHRKLGRKLRN